MNNDQLFDFFKIAEKMKTVKRDNLLSNGEYDSDADHSYLLSLMVWAFHPYLKNKVNLERALKIALVHDMAEAKTGDVPLHKSANNPEIQANKDAAEQKAAKEIFATLPAELNNELMSAWREYEERITPEAKYVKALDKIEAIFQAIIYSDIHYWENYGDGRIYYDNVLNDRRKHFWAHEPVLAEFADYLKHIIIEKMTAAGLNPEDYIDK